RQLVIEVETIEQEKVIFLKVKDNGKGMDVNKVKDKIFGLYQRFHTNDSKGLGLYLIKAQLAAYNATIHFESTVDVGTVFTITFPK
ncbi:MAG: ATP-binding protein, partial [Chitinophagaceae bacterium]